jgi:hypothetical protein
MINRRRARSLREDDLVDDRHSGEQLAEDIGGWSTGGRANASVVTRWAAWGVIALGPILAGAALFTSSASPTVPEQRAAAPSAPAGGQGAAGFAALFVDAYVGAGEDSQDSLTPYYPGAADLDLQGTPGVYEARQTTVVRLRQTAPTVWSVTVAANLARTTSAADSSGEKGQSGLRYFQVPVATGPGGGGATGYVALSLPAEVTAPPRIQAPSLGYGPMGPVSPSDPRTETVAEFLSAYLTGQSDISRMLAPGTTIQPIRPAPYTTVAVEQIALDAQIPTDGADTAVPADGTRERLLVNVTASTGDVERQLSYALTLAARAGRWEVASLDGAPTLAPADSTASTGRTPQ